MKPRFPLSLTLWCVLPSLFLASSCGDGSGGNSLSPVEGLSTVEFLSLQTVTDTEQLTESEGVQHLSATDSASWKVKGASGRLVNAPLRRGGKKVDVFLVEDPERISLVRIPGPFDPASFNRLALTAKWNQKWEAAIELRSKGKGVARTAGRIVPPEAGQETLFFDLPETRNLKAPIDEIVLRMTDMRKPFRIVSVDLIRKAEHLFLPTTDSGARLVAIGEQSRNAVGLSTSRKITAKVSDLAGARLRFSYGVPGNLRRKDESAFLKVSLVATGVDKGRETTEVSIPLKSSEVAVPWQQRVIPLGGFGADEIEIEWSVEGASPGTESVCALGEVTVLRPGGHKRAVVFVTSDTHRGDHMGLAGEGVDIETPVLDALGERGVFFEDCFSTTNITNPSHIAMMTGMHPRDTGIHNNYTRVADAAPTLAEAFRSAGYVTYAALSTKHLGDPSSGLGQGFERVVYPAYDFAQDGSKTLRQLRTWIEESEGLPVFVWLHLFDAHMPYGKNTPGVSRYYAGKRRAFDKKLPELAPRVRKAVRALHLEGLRDLDYPRAMYKAEITDMDERLGELFAMPFFGGAVMAITADHGESLGEHDLYFAHEELYRSSLHVPLILTWPGAPAGARYAGPVSNLDVGRTLLDLSGNLAVEFPGSNLAVLLDGDGVGPARFSLSAHGREAAMTEDGWHFQLRLKPNDKREGTVSRPKHWAELYYLPDDPGGTKNLLKKEFARAKAMRASLVHWLESAQDLDWLGGDSGNAESLADLITLGYAGKDEDPVDEKAPGLAPRADCGCEQCEMFR